MLHALLLHPSALRFLRGSGLLMGPAYNQGNRMNLLLETLRRSGVVTGEVIALTSQDQCAKVIGVMKNAALFHMGNEARPGPYWAVFDSADAKALAGKGYKRIPTN